MKQTEALIKETIRLDVVDKQLEFNIKDNFNSQKKIISSNYEEYQGFVKDTA